MFTSHIALTYESQLSTLQCSLTIHCEKQAVYMQSHDSFFELSISMQAFAHVYARQLRHI